MRLRRRTAGLAAVATLLALTAGCGDDPTGQESSGHGSHGDASGSHGGSHQGSDHSGGHAAAEITPPPGADWNAEDAAYLLDMIAHHRQAIVMSELVPDRASSESVRRLASGIDAGQGAEILTMAAWLDEHDVPVPTLEEVEDHRMPGMLSDAQLDDLEAADGPEFDELYLTGMIQHHEGALQMAEDQVAEGLDPVVVAMASEVIAGQTAEIDRMRTILES